MVQEMQQSSSSSFPSSAIKYKDTSKLPHAHLDASTTAVRERDREEEKKEDARFSAAMDALSRLTLSESSEVRGGSETRPALGEDGGVASRPEEQVDRTDILSRDGESEAERRKKMRELSPSVAAIFEGVSRESSKEDWRAQQQQQQQQQVSSVTLASSSSPAGTGSPGKEAKSETLKNLLHIGTPQPHAQPNPNFRSPRGYYPPGPPNIGHHRYPPPPGLMQGYPNMGSPGYPQQPPHAGTFGPPRYPQPPSPNVPSALLRLMGPRLKSPPAQTPTKPGLLPTPDGHSPQAPVRGMGLTLIL